MGFISISSWVRFCFLFCYFYFGRSHINWPITQVFWNIGELPPQENHSFDLENIKSAKEIECSQYKSIASPVCPKPHSYFLTEIAWYLGTLCTHILSCCYECFKGHITCPVTCYIPLIHITCLKHA